MPYANIFGYVHNSPMFKTYSRQHYCVSAERIEYTSISLEDIQKRGQEGEKNLWGKGRG